MADPGYDGMVARAATLRAHLPTSSVIGLAAPPGIDAEAYGLVKTDDEDWRPFVAAGTLHERTVLMLPEVSAHKKRIEAIRLLRMVGGNVLIVIEACTALRPRFSPGSLVMVADHINLTGVNPLAGPNDDRIGPRFPNMTEPYDGELLTWLEHIAIDERVLVQRCVFAAVSHNPTPAECRFLAYVGADVYGFGLVPDTVTAVHAGLRVLALATVQSSRIPDGPITHGADSADRASVRILSRALQSEWRL